MNSVAVPAEPDWHRTPRGRRTLAILLVLLIHVLLVGAFLTLSLANKSPLERRMQVFDVAPEPVPAPKPTPAKAPHKVEGARPKTTPVVKPKTEVPPKLFTTELMPAVDITQLPNHSKDTPPGEGTGDTGTGHDSVAVYGPGGGPHGEPLYKAEWYTEPTHAELAYYQPKSIANGSWATVACRTVERFRVEDCQELDESPRGSGLARSLRLASWQFRVKPPKIGGRYQIGAWVSIRIDWTDAAADKE